MEAALWGLIGTVVGAVLTIVGNIVLHATERSARRRDQAAAAQLLARDERKAAYTKLLTTARKLRYIARDPTGTPRSELDALRTELSTVQYEIELIAPIALVTAANNVRRSTLDYLNLALGGASAEDRQELRDSSRRDVGALIAAAREDLRIAPDSWPTSSPIKPS